jgi:Zn-dependent protease
MNTFVDKGCIRLFKVAGITVLLHWSWLLVAFFEITQRADTYPSLAWNVGEYLALFGIVLLHEFGHALACRQVGGTAEQIILWPLGGIAYVNPPPRPGALLWSIAAGPLVNVMLAPATLVLAVLVAHLATPPGLESPPAHFCVAVFVVNLLLLGFNILPIYPLDGGQILHALLWIVLGRARSLMVCSVIGLIGAAGLFLLALSWQSTWGLILTVFLALQAVAGVSRARTLVWLQPAQDELRRAVVLVGKRAYQDAVAACDRALELIPEGHQSAGAAYLCRAGALAALGEYAAAITDYDQALELQPAQHVVLNNLAWLCATCPDSAFRNGERAVQYATRACAATGWKKGCYLGTLAAAYAEMGDFAAAINWQRKAFTDPTYEQPYGEKARERILLYEAGKPYRQEAAEKTDVPGAI